MLYMDTIMLMQVKKDTFDPRYRDNIQRRVLFPNVSRAYLFISIFKGNLTRSTRHSIRDLKVAQSLCQVTRRLRHQI